MDARRLLEEGFGNPPDNTVLGILAPEGVSPFDAPWLAVVTYEDTGFVTDQDTPEAYAEVLQQMRDAEPDINRERKTGGYEPVHLVGWAVPPSYDATAHRLVWAREMKFGDETENTLNYDVRHLTRYGVLSLNMISTMSDLAKVREGAAALGPVVTFDKGARYTDRVEGDKAAGLGLAGLVAGGAGLVVAQKLGALGVALLFLKKGLAVIVTLGAGVVAWIRRTFGRRSARPAPAFGSKPDDFSPASAPASGPAEKASPDTAPADPPSDPSNDSSP